jgi:hypothetical protein
MLLGSAEIEPRERKVFSLFSELVSRLFASSSIVYIHNFISEAACQDSFLVFEFSYFS